MTLALTIILVAAAGILAAEAIAYLLYRKKAPADRKKALETLLRGRASSLPSPYKDSTMSSNHLSRYSEHPFIGWSLNPGFLTESGSKIHNRQGFRVSKDFEDIDSDAIRIYCAGGSSTYCTEIEQNEETWPDRLGHYLNEQTDAKVEVINGGVGGFNTFQSFIRLSAYIDNLKPNLVVVYHAKNDLNSFYHETADQRNVLPDYSNSMKSLNLQGLSGSVNPLVRISNLAKLWAIWRFEINRYTLMSAYINPLEKDISTYLSARLDYSIIETMQQNMVSLCRGRGIPLLYLTQRVEDPMYTSYIEELNSRIRSLDNPEKGCFVYDLDRELTRDPNLLMDKMHYTPWGCEQVAQSVGQFLRSSRIVSQLGESVVHQ